ATISGGEDLINLVADTYTLVVTDNTNPYNQCSSTAEFVIADDLPVIAVRTSSINTTPDTNCDNNNANGSISITAIHVDGIAVSGAELANYSVTWNDLNGGETLNTVDVTNDRVINVLPGTYTGTISKTNGNMCSSSVFSVTVDQEGITPVMTETSSENTYCSGGNGSVTIEVTAPDTDEANYQFDWYEGQGTTGTFRADLSGIGNNTANGLAPMFYTVLVTTQSSASNGTGCSDQIIVEVKDNPDLLSIPVSGTDLSTNITNCSPDNGQIIIDGITLNGADITDEATLATYSYELFDSSDASLGAFANAGSGAASDFPSTNADLSAGTYFVRVTNTTTGCVSSPRAIIIDSDATKPELSLVVDQVNTSCDPATADGELTVTISGPDSDSNYDVQWYFGVITSGTAELLADGAAAASGFTPSITTSGTAPTMTSNISGLMEGSYYVVVTDNSNPNNNCNQNFAKTIIQDTTFNISLDLTVLGHQTNCTPNGEVEVTSVDLTRLNGASTSNTSGVGGVAPVLAVYDLELLDENLSNAVTISSDTDLQGLSAGTYYIQATHQTYQCVSLEKQFVINETIFYPEAATETVTQNSSCTTSGNGSISITLETNSVANAYTVDWRDGSTASAPATSGTVAIAANTFTLSDLSSGFYTAVINDATSGCSVNFTYEIGDSLRYPVVNVPADQIVHNTICNTPGNGTITITDADITIAGTQPGTTAFTWTYSNGVGTIVDQAIPGASPIVLTNLDADTYTLVATSATGCASSSFEVIILDESQNPVIDSFTMTPNSNCTGTVALGAIELTSIDGAAPSAGSYTYQWYVGSSATGGQEVSTILGETDDAELLQNVPDGFYTVEITNTDATTNTNCSSTQTIEVQNDPEYPIIASYEVNKNLICTVPGNGSFVVTGVRYQGNSLSMGNSADSLNLTTNFTLSLFDSDEIFIKNGNAANPMEISGLSEGSYFAAIEPIDSECESQKVQFEIIDKPFNPEIQIVVVEADSTCSTTGTTPNGALLAIPDNASNPIHIDSSYVFTWFEVDAAGTRQGTSLSSNDTLFSQYAGRYEVVVENINAGCTSQAYFTLENVPLEIEIIAVDSANMTTCSPSNAYFEVTGMSTGSLSDYTFAFYDQDPSTGTPTPIQDGTDSIASAAVSGTSIVAGDYYIIATSIATGCVSNIYQIEIEDETTPPSIVLDDFSLQMNCDPANPNGTLTVSANGSQDNTLYTFEWIDDSDGSVVEANNASATGLSAGSYTINVTEVATGCTSSETFGMIDDLLDPIPLTPQITHNTNCIDPNGQASVNINITSDEFTTRGITIQDFGFYWYTGNLDGTVPDLSAADTVSNFYTGLAEGTYSVYVINETDSGCNGTWRVVNIQDKSVKPEFRIDIVNHLTICYPDKPNGRAKVGFPIENISAYSFTWYDGPTINDDSLKTGYSIDSLAAGTYAVEVTSLITGCSIVGTFDIIDATEEVPAPSLNLLGHRTSCVEPDGRARASVAGQTEGYEFNWAKKDSPMDIEFTGVDYGQMDTATYVVTATDLSTGCTSATREVTILNMITDPEFEVRSKSSLCLRTEDGSQNQFNGQAEIVFLNDSTGQIATEVTWFGPYSITSKESTLIDAPPGLWTVEFKANNGCLYTAEFEIETSLRVYNGMSVNNDGDNEFFLIDCIDQFPDNKVTIFNRDGTRIFEIEGYDNFDKRFDGVSNVGKSGFVMPMGTYFYIIEKGDGSDPIQGYLELVR
ncbi:MAG: gliding motility-associated C-terminal domain-containing protein, partial [Cyclobacteriaceae bacterium]